MSTSGCLGLLGVYQITWDLEPEEQNGHLIRKPEAELQNDVLKSLGTTFKYWTIRVYSNRALHHANVRKQITQLRLESQELSRQDLCLILETLCPASLPVKNKELSPLLLLGIRAACSCLCSYPPLRQELGATPLPEQS